MRILVISDVPEKKYWDYYKEGDFDQFDLILSCGDLPPQYLEFIVTLSNKTLLYVHGNHDDCYLDTPPDGCICIEDTVYDFKGLRIAGLGGSNRYKDGKFMFTDKEMKHRVRKLRWKLLRNKKLDMILAHSAIKGFDDDEDIPHQGFSAFEPLIDNYKPKYFIHGHIHLNYGRKHKRLDSYKGMTVINACGSYILDIEDQI